MLPTVNMVVKGLLTQGYKEIGGSDVFRLLCNPQTKQVIKVFYDNYDEPGEIIVRESILGIDTPISHVNEEDINHGSCIGE